MLNVLGDKLGSCAREADPRSALRFAAGARSPANPAFPADAARVAAPRWCFVARDADGEACAHQSISDHGAATVGVVMDAPSDPPGVAARSVTAGDQEHADRRSRQDHRSPADRFAGFVAGGPPGAHRRMVQRSWSVSTDRGTTSVPAVGPTDASTAGCDRRSGTIALMHAGAVGVPLRIAVCGVPRGANQRLPVRCSTPVKVRNLAGRVVYGLLGLGIFVKILDGWRARRRTAGSGFFLVRWIGNVLDWLFGNNGRDVVIAGWCCALDLPIVIITTIEALRRRPANHEGRTCVGPYQWEMLRHHV